MKMPEPMPVTLVGYDSNWPQIAAKHSAVISSLGAVIVAVHHIGSTAVPGLTAKPIIDLMPLVTNLVDLDQLRFHLESLGYQWHGEFGIPGRRFCTRADKTGTRLVHAHFFESSSPHVRRHIAFRDYLRENRGFACRYALEKRRAQALHPNNSHAYSEEKAAWIRTAETTALLWSSAYQGKKDN